MYRGKNIQRKKQAALTGALGAAMLVTGAGVGTFILTAPAAVIPVASAPTTTGAPATTPTTTGSTTGSTSGTTSITSAPSTSNTGSTANLVSTTSLSTIIGQVVSQTPTTLFVKDQSGLVHAVSLSGVTHYSQHSRPATRAAVTPNTIVMVQGLWNANHTVLEARLVGVAGKAATGGDDGGGNGGSDN